MKKLAISIVAAAALVFTSVAAAGLVPGVYDPGTLGCVTSTYSHGVLHLAKTCPTTANAAAGADITGVAGQTFESASFTLANASQCQGGSPRFDVVIGSTVFFLGCNNVTPTINSDGTATYTFTAATLAAAGNQVPFPTGAIGSMDILVDVQGAADITAITVNGKAQKIVTPRTDAQSKCKNGAWKTFTDPKFKNQGQCVSHFMHQLNHAKQELNAHHRHNNR
jgi:hypothetical protein